MVKKIPQRTWRVYINQVNQTWIDVKATSAEAAKNKACREWSRSYGPSVMGAPLDRGLEEPEK